MKKIILSAAFIILLGTAYSFAGGVVNNNYNLQNEKKSKVAEDELPQGIKNLLKTEEYKDWKLDQAYMITGTGEYYKVELKKDDQKQTLNLDKYGNKVSVIGS